MGDAEKNYEAAKEAFMGAMNERFVKEFGFDLKTIMLFADAISRVKTSREKQLEAELEKVRKDRDKAVEMLRSLASYHGACFGCKRAKKECSRVLLCKVDGKNHWEWGGAND